MDAQQDKDQAMHQSSGITPFQKSNKWLTFEEIEVSLEQNHLVKLGRNSCVKVSWTLGKSAPTL